MKYLKTYEGFNFFGKEIANYQNINVLHMGLDQNIIVKEYDDYYQFYDLNDNGKYKMDKYPKSEYSKSDVLQIAADKTGYNDDPDEWNKFNNRDEWNKFDNVNLEEDPFVSEEINLKKTLVGGALAAGLLGGGAYIHDKSIEPTEIVQSQHTDIPNNFQMKQKILTFGTDMWLTNDNKDNFGKVEERILSWGKKFEYIDNTGKKLATAKEQIFTLWTKIDISDENGNHIGTVEQEVMESFTSLIYSVYSIKDSNGNVIAKSKKIDFFTTFVDLYDMEGKPVASFRKKVFTLADKWDINVTSDIDKRLIVFIPSFISSSQSEKDDDSSDE